MEGDPATSNSFIRKYPLKLRAFLRILYGGRKAPSAIASHRGFTLIEILIVLLIIAALITIIIVVLTIARNKSSDTRIISDLEQHRRVAQGYYESNNASYAGFDLCVKYPALGYCGTQETADAIATLRQDIQEANGLPNSLVAYANESQYCISAPTKSDQAIHVCAQGKGDTSTQINSSWQCTYDETQGPICTSKDQTSPTQLTPPQPTQQSPMHQQTEVAPDSQITMEFNRPMRKGAGTITLTNTTTGNTAATLNITSSDVQVEGENVTITLPETLALESQYAVSITDGALKDTNFLSYPGIQDTTSWTFTTPYPPELLTFTPPDQTQNVPVTTNLTMGFDKSILGGPGSIRIFKSDGTPVNAINSISNEVQGRGTANLTINPTWHLPYQSSLYITVDQSAFVSSFGLPYAGISGNTTWRLTTGNQCWSEYFIDPSVGGVLSLDTADFDRDGDIDIAAAANNNDSYYWYENRGGSPITWAKNLVGTSDEARVVYVIDMNRDGRKDIVTGAYTSAEVSWYENRVSGNPSNPINWIKHSVPNPGSGWDVYADDMDNDGDIDILFAGYSNVAWMENMNGSGDSWNLHNIPLSNPQGNVSISSADFNGDGRKDILLCPGNNDRVVRWARNQASGNPSNPISWTEYFQTGVYCSGSDSALIPGDVDSDGDVDFVRANEWVGSGNRLFWHENDGGGNFAARQIQQSGVIPKSVYVSDMDGDGDTDIIVGSDFENEHVPMFENRGGNPINWNRINIPSSVGLSYAVLSSDLDNDGYRDLMKSRHNIVWYKQRMCS